MKTSITLFLNNGPDANYFETLEKTRKRLIWLFALSTPQLFSFRNIHM